MKTFLIILLAIGCIDLIKTFNVTDTEYFSIRVKTLVDATTNKTLKIHKKLDYIEDLREPVELLQQINQQILNQNIQKHIYEVQEEVRRLVILKSVPVLANIFNDRQVSAEAYNFHKYLANNLEVQLLKVIYTKALEEILYFQHPHLLAAHLHQIITPASENVKLLELILHAQVHLLQALQAKNLLNDWYLFNVAYYLYDLQHQQQYYSQLDIKQQQNLTNAIKTLPKTLQYLYFKSEFCLFNAKNQYLYTGYYDLNINTNSRYNFLWFRPNEVGPQGAFLANITALPSKDLGELNLKLSLKSKRFNIFWYLETDIPDRKDIIAGWNPGNAPAGSTWSLAFTDNVLLFHQNGHLMCNSEVFHDKTEERIYVNGFNDDNHTAKTSTCQWFAGECPP